LRLSLLGSIVVALIYSQVYAFALIVLTAICYDVIRAGIIPLSDLIATNYCDKIKYDFGRVRAFGSFGWMLGAMLLGFLVDGLSVDIFGRTIGFDGMIGLGMAVFGLYIIFALTAFGMTFFLSKNEHQTSVEKAETKNQISLSDIKILFANKNFRFIMFFMLITILAVDGATGYSANHLVTVLGAPVSIISWLMFAMVLPEVLMLPWMGRFVAKFGFKTLYYVAVITMIIRLFVYGTTTNTTAFLLISMVHGIGIGMHISGNFAYIRKVVDPKMLALAFTVTASVSALSKAVLRYAYGFVYEYISSFTVYRISGVILVFALLVLIRTKKFDDVEALVPDSI